MNEADSGRVAAELDALGYAPTDDPKQADVIVLNTCVVRQSAEDRAVGHLWSLKPLKERDPHRVIALMGCLVGIRPNPALVQRFPFVDVFMPPSEPGPLIQFLTTRAGTATADQEAAGLEAEGKELDAALTAERHAFQDYGSPEAETGSWKLEAGNWKLETGSWKLETGSWKLETGSWKLETDDQQPASSFQLPATGNQQPASSFQLPA
ncbi:MAG: hypothetical protein WHX53_16060, partial [Anaerolineae bacterium]